MCMVCAEWFVARADEVPWGHDLRLIPDPGVFKSGLAPDLCDHVGPGAAFACFGGRPPASQF